MSTSTQSHRGLAVYEKEGFAVNGSPAISIPFAHLNLRRNPFGEFSSDEIALLADVQIDEIAANLADPRYAVQFVGEKGYGKTTHLLALRDRFPEAGYVHIGEGERAAIPLGNPLLIDEAQRLTRRQRRQVFGSCEPLVLGTHVDFHRSLIRAGRRVETVEVGRRMNPQRLHALLNARIHWVRRNEGPLPAICIETAIRLLQRFGPDVRQIQRELYNVFQSMSFIQNI
jgi:hypothetical protein